MCLCAYSSTGLYTTWIESSCVPLRVFFYWFVYYLDRVNDVLGAPSKAAGGWSTLNALSLICVYSLRPLCAFLRGSYIPLMLKHNPHYFCACLYGRMMNMDEQREEIPNAEGRFRNNCGHHARNDPVILYPYLCYPSYVSCQRLIPPS